MSSIKVVVYTLGRTGSTLLQELLNNLSDSRVEGEILSSSVEAPFDFITQRANASQVGLYGFKVKTIHLEANGVNPQDFLDSLEAQGWKLIHLKRENIFNMIVSYMYATSTKQWFSYKSKLGFLRQKPKVTLDADKLMALLEENIVRNSFDDSLLAKRDHLKLSYEDDLLEPSSHVNCLEKITGYLGCPAHAGKVSIKMEKNIPEPSSVISNWPEVIQVMEASRFKGYL